VLAADSIPPINSAVFHYLRSVACIYSGAMFVKIILIGYVG